MKEADPKSHGNRLKEVCRSGEGKSCFCRKNSQGKAELSPWVEMARAGTGPCASNTWLVILLHCNSLTHSSLGFTFEPSSLPRLSSLGTVTLSSAPSLSFST